MLAPRSSSWQCKLETTGLMANSRVGCFRMQPPVDNIQQNRDPVTISVAGAPLVGFVTRTYGGGDFLLCLAGYFTDSRTG